MNPRSIVPGAAVVAAVFFSIPSARSDEAANRRALHQGKLNEGPRAWSAQIMALGGTP